MFFFRRKSERGGCLVAGVNKKPFTWPFQDRQFQNQDRLTDSFRDFYSIKRGVIMTFYTSQWYFRVKRDDSVWIYEYHEFHRMFWKANLTLTGFLHFRQSSGSGQSELLWPSWRQLKHFSGSGQSSWGFYEDSSKKQPDAHFQYNFKRQSPSKIPWHALPCGTGGTLQAQGSQMPCAPVLVFWRSAIMK